MEKVVSRCITVTTKIDGTNGTNGYSNAVVQLYRRYAPTQAVPTPALPTGTLTYTFSTGVLSGATASFSGWSQQIPAATDGTRLFVTMATARSQEATDSISENEWSTPVEYVADGMAYASVTIYKRNPSAPTDKPSDKAKYYFKTVGSIKAGTLVAPSGGSLNGWSTDIPSTNANHDPCWVRHATAVAKNTDNYDEIGVGEWSDPATKLVEDGHQGPKGTDAQDFEWVYILTKTNIAPVIDGDGGQIPYTDHNGKTYTSDGHLPKVVPGTGGRAVDIWQNNSGVTGKPYECSSNPKGVDDTWQFEWEIKRTKGDAVNGQRSWKYYGQGGDGKMTLHNNFAASAFIIDLDNDNDQFGADSESKVLATQERSTKVTLYDGATPQTLKTNGGLSVDLRYEDDTSVPTTGANAVATYTATPSTGEVKVTILQNTNTAFSHEAIKALITATDTNNRSKSAVFTIRKILSGQPGLSPTIYQIAPTLKAFSFYRDANDELSPPSQSSQINVAETIGNTTTIRNSALTGITYKWGFDDSTTAVMSNQPVGSSIQLPVSDQTNHHDATSHYQIWVQLMHGTAEGDRETLPIVKDGEKGAKGDQGDNAPYDVAWYARYTTRGADSTTGAPTGSTDTGWRSTAPAPSFDNPYIWQKTEHYNSSGVLEGTSYTCLTGADGPQGQQGQRGLTGRMYYIAGKWNETTQYSRTTDLCPVVYYKVGSGSNMIEWWYLIVENSTGNTPYDGSGYWSKVENFGVVLTEAIFVKEFAQFGACIITGDWLISVHGKINSVEKGGSVENPENWNGSPTYTWFDPLFPGGQLSNLFFDGSTYCANQEHVGWQGDNYDYKDLTDVGAFNLLSQNKYAVYGFRMIIVPSNATDFYVHFLLKSGSVRKYLGGKLIEENTQQELTFGNVTLSADGSYMLAAELQYMGNISSWTYPELYSGAADRGLNYVPIFYKSTSGGNPGTPTFTKMEQISGDSSLSNTWCRYNQNSGTVYVSWGLKSNTNTPGFWLKKFYIERTDNYMFIPNYAVDLKTGRSYQNDAHLKGLISTLNDMVVVKEENQTVGNGWLTITDRGLFCRNDKDDSNNEVIAAIGVHKESQQSYVYEKGFVDLITRAKNSSNYDYATISGTGAYFTRHEVVGGVDEITQTHVNYSYVDTNEVRTNNIIGRGYESGYGYLPVAMPQNIITGSGNKNLPANPKEGMVVFAKGTGGNMTVRGNGKKIMSSSGTSEVDDFSILSNSFIFAYDGIRWIAFCCTDT